jgi:hypothetical protein
VGVVRAGVTIAGVTPEGTTARIRQIAAGPNLAFQWFTVDGYPVEDSDHFQGTTSSTLTISNIRPEHEGWYHCVVLNIQTGGELPGLRHYVTVEPLPAIDEYELPHEAMVSRSMSMVPLTRNLVTRYEVRNLPLGLKFNTKTGVVTGTPRKAGTHRFQVRGFNSAGPSPWKTITLTVAPIPEFLIGAFDGLVGRMLDTGEGMGGACSLSVTSTGTTTGYVDIGSKRYALTGRLNCTVGGSNTLSCSLAGGVVDLLLAHDLATSSMAGTLAARDGSWVIPLLAKKVGVSANTASWAGSTSVDIAPQVVQSEVPSGRGTGVIKISSKGTYTWSGKLADGAAYTCAGRLTPSGQFAARTLLYTNKGSVQGWQQVNTTTRQPSGSLEWMKNPRPGAVSFPNGFPLHTLVVSPATL